MLIFTRRKEESIIINGDIKIILSIIFINFLFL